MLKKIEDYQLRELEENKIYINIYDLSIKYNYEMALYLKNFYFDVLDAFSKKEGFVCNSGLPATTKEYIKIIKKYHLNIDIKDYPEICDYVTFEEWCNNPDNGIAYFKNNIYLITKDIQGDI